ncbi:DJ-1/PfpI family protein [Alicyclobacillus contaminans]|uniref:DJ-1/PfpI family protein n=1 Tax=Alicyclobacillus contaminans TaxID=392016 RepID=UPI0003FF1F96|nr:DJ-1/PfpI family protein [Alicyclobacillus contaminans]
MSKRVLILTGDAVEALEVFYPYYRLLEAEVEAVIAAPSVKKLNTVVHDFVGWDTYTEKPAYLLEAHVAFSDVQPETFDGLILPGGRAPEYIRLQPDVPRIVRHFFEAGKPVGAICHAAQVLEVVRDVVAGRSMTAYIACKPSVEAMGATYKETGLHVDGNLVSGHAWPDLPGFMREFMKLLNA